MWATVWEAAIPAEHVDAIRRVGLTHTDDGKVRADRLHGTIADEAMPVWDAEQVAAKDGTGYDSVADQVAGLSGTFAPLASPTFTGTLTTPNLTATGDSTLGNGDTDATIIQGHDRHKSAAPSPAAGVALGTGGSVGVTVSGSDQSGTITLTAGTTSLTTGIATTVTFATARPNTQFSVVVTPLGINAGANAVQYRSNNAGTATWTISFGVAPTSGTVYSYHYQIKEWTN